MLTESEATSIAIALGFPNGKGPEWLLEEHRDILDISHLAPLSPLDLIGMGGNPLLLCEIALGFPPKEVWMSRKQCNQLIDNLEYEICYYRELKDIILNDLLGHHPCRWVLVEDISNDICCPELVRWLVKHPESFKGQVNAIYRDILIDVPEYQLIRGMNINDHLKSDYRTSYKKFYQQLFDAAFTEEFGMPNLRSRKIITAMMGDHTRDIFGMPIKRESPMEFPIDLMGKIVQLKEPKDMQVEGKLMNHCVESMVRYLKYVEAYFFHIGDPAPGGSTLFIKLVNGKFIMKEFKAYNNNKPSAEDSSLVELFIEQANAAPAWKWDSKGIF